MKYPQKTRIDVTDIYDLQTIIPLCDFLSALSIASAADVAAHCENILEHDFCSYCERHNDDCSCKEDSYGGRYMREYDDGADFED